MVIKRTYARSKDTINRDFPTQMSRLAPIAEARGRIRVGAAESQQSKGCRQFHIFRDGRGNE